MVDRLVHVILDYQITNGTLKEDEKSVYQYGYTLLLEKMINTMVAFIICILTGRWIEVLLLLLCIIPLRSYAGGWHAKKFLNCSLISNAVILVGININLIIELKVYYYIFIEAIIFAIIVSIAPVQHNNKELSNNERVAYRKKSIFIWAVECCILHLCLWFEKSDLAIIILFSHIMICIAALVGKIDNKYNK